MSSWRGICGVGGTAYPKQWAGWEMESVVLFELGRGSIRSVAIRDCESQDEPDALR